MKIKFFIVLCTLLLIIFSTNVNAWTPVFYARRTDLGNELVFYMMPPRYARRIGIYIETPDGYPEVGGLYRNGELVYTFDDYLYWDSLFFSADGMTFLAIPSRPRDSIRFFNEGVEMHYHRVQYLLPYGDTFLGETDLWTGVQPWRIIAKTNHDRANNRLSITTMQGDEITFCLTAGLILSQSRVFNPADIARGNRIAPLIGFAGLILVGIGICIFLKRNQRIKK